MPLRPARGLSSNSPRACKVGSCPVSAKLRDTALPLAPPHCRPALEACQLRGHVRARLRAPPSAPCRALPIAQTRATPVLLVSRHCLSRPLRVAPGRRPALPCSSLRSTPCELASMRACLARCSCCRCRSMVTRTHFRHEAGRCSTRVRLCGAAVRAAACAGPCRKGLAPQPCICGRAQQRRGRHRRVRDARAQALRIPHRSVKSRTPDVCPGGHLQLPAYAVQKAH